MQREKHVRALLVQGASDEAVDQAWNALRSLGNAEANRLNQLLSKMLTNSSSSAKFDE